MNRKVLLGLFFFFLAINAILVSNFLITGRSRSTLEQSSAQEIESLPFDSSLDNVPQAVRTASSMTLTSSQGGFSVSFSDIYEFLARENPGEAIVSYGLKYKGAAADTRLLAQINVWDPAFGKSQESLLPASRVEAQEAGFFVPQSGRVYMSGSEINVFVDMPSGNVFHIRVPDSASWVEYKSDLSFILESVGFN